MNATIWAAIEKHGLITPVTIEPYAASDIGDGKQRLHRVCLTDAASRFVFVDVVMDRDEATP